MNTTDRGGPRAGLLNQMTALLYEADPVGLARLGAPEDEYALEAATIIRRLDSASSEDELHEIVCDEFFCWFGEDAGPRERYRDITRAIWASGLERDTICREERGEI